MPGVPRCRDQGHQDMVCQSGCYWVQVRLVEDSKLGKESSGVGCSSAACASQRVSQASLPVRLSSAWSLPSRIEPQHAAHSCETYPTYPLPFFKRPAVLPRLQHSVNTPVSSLCKPERCSGSKGCAANQELLLRAISSPPGRYKWGGGASFLVAVLQVQYSLHSLVNHSGPSALCGHFTADVCDVSTGAWHRWAELWGERGHCSRGGPKGAERKHVCVKHLRLQQLLTPGHARPRHSLL